MRPRCPHVLAAAALIGLAPPAIAEGFRISALDAVEVDVSGFATGPYEIRSEPDRLTVACTGCDGLVAVDVTLSQSTDGTEERYRSGQTTATQMEELCQARAPECTLQETEVQGAVGWTTTYDADAGKASTSVLFQHGDMLIIRSIAPTSEMAAQNMQTALNMIATQITRPTP